ncbi:hypothetical protein NIES25_69920 (plasmid) [Nostoc linckia NIES-25]|nr:hypothetical protein NIES25_69920 [Nostoc linckia NIES-25]
MNQPLEQEQIPNWLEAIFELERMVADNNPDVAEEGPEIATLSSVLFFGALLICNGIFLNAEKPK